jgi:uncharacterized protein
MQKILTLLFVLIFYSCLPQSKSDSVSKIVTDINKNNSLNGSFEYAIDLTSFLDHASIEKLELKLKNYNTSPTNQIYFFIVDFSETNEEPFDLFAVNLSNSFVPNNSKKVNNLTIIISPKIRKLRISTSNEAQKVLTDEICKKIIDSIIVPEFKKANYYEGLDKGIDEIIRLWK